MTEETREPTLDERVVQLEQAVELLRLDLDSARTANEVLQTRYGVLASQYAALTARVEELQPAEGL